MDNSTSAAAARAKKKKHLIKLLISAVRGLFLIGICFTVLYPIFSKLCYSFMDISDVFNPNITYLPDKFTLKNYRAAISILNYLPTFLNTFTVSITTAVIQLATSLFVAYGLARFKFKGNKFLFFSVIFVMVIPPDLLLLPRYFQFRFFDFCGIIKAVSGHTVSLVDTFVPFWLLGLTCTGLKNGLYIFILRQHFLGLPKALEEAAEVDGAGPFRTFFQIVLPGSVNTAITVFMFSFVWQWNDSVYTPVFFNNTRVFSNSISLIQQKAHVALEVLNMSLASSLVGAAGLILVLLPVLLLYAVAQKYFTQSIVTSGITG